MEEPSRFRVVPRSGGEVDLLRFAVGQGISCYAPSGTLPVVAQNSLLLRPSLEEEGRQGLSPWLGALRAALTARKEEPTDPLVAETGYKW